MPQKRYKAEAIIGKLREAEVLSSQGMDVEAVLPSSTVGSLRVSARGGMA